MKIVQQDILTINRGFILHQVNCQGKMNAGLAKAIRDKWPQTFKDYIEYLGKNPNGTALGGFKLSRLSTHHYVVHCYGQNHYGNDGKQYTDYDALRECLTAFNFYKTIVHDIGDKEPLPMYAPYQMGCGYGGGDWNVVSGIMKTYTPEIIICQKIA